MKNLTQSRLWVLRAMYVFIVVGLSLTIWPELRESVGSSADAHTVVSTFLIAIMLLSLLGVAYPLKLIPILLFEIVWKGAWLLLFALPKLISGDLDEYSYSVAVACLMGIILIPAAIPWKFVWNQYVPLQVRPAKSPM
ncbi:hypothetical protein QWI17_15205 [Gilvimarinus sp. SDUM040013]|uniref:Uncharacterized protein n=1 Tax=Gilvimarinus gilvus TaxID=3058038 RepID=A0ABU4S0S1_9GAMM|nr:hypothetical protein [Gilvimarinus sp. SDUM040013]MDO3387189.1 hypothetical protein [Gilvimarinus sp. SDUM040013]MDX6850752.1 hypothetical protein [Gilvimarinus sp. SDUM040013]